MAIFGKDREGKPEEPKRGEGPQRPDIRSVTIPEVEYQLVRRIAYQEERTQQDVLAEAVRMLFESRALQKDLEGAGYG